MIDKIIWTYWHQGFDQAPEIVKKCVDKWQALNPEWNLHLLDKDNVKDYVEPLPIKKETLDRMILPHISDLVRTQLLIRYGGVWADPTTFPLQPLDNWIHKNLQAGYFFFYKPGRDRIIANWFIAAKKNNEMVSSLYAALINYWNSNTFKNTNNPKKNKYVSQINRLINRNLWLPKLWFTPFFTKLLRFCTYMVYHHMFYNLISKDKNKRLNFEKMPKISADTALVINPKNAFLELDNEIKKIIDQKLTPVLKLKWNYDVNAISNTSNLGYLLHHK